MPQAEPRVVSEPKLPPKPPQTSFIGWIRAPTIHYAQYALPRLVIRNPHSATLGSIFHKKLEKVRKWGELYGYLTHMLWHAEQEEEFLRLLAREMKRDWGHETESGRREIKAMRYDTIGLIVDYELREDIRVERQLRKWANQHPNEKFLPYGMKIPGRRKQLKAWTQRVKALKRERENKLYHDRFMRHWRDTFEEDPLFTKFKMERGRQAKNRAKKKRKLLMGNYFL